MEMERTSCGGRPLFTHDDQVQVSSLRSNSSGENENKNQVHSNKSNQITSSRNRSSSQKRLFCSLVKQVAALLAKRNFF